ncbi:MAG: peptidase M28 [bacterium]|nr:peptidase M28 [bacterium]
MNDHRALYKDITDAFGPSGFESEAASVARRYLKNAADEIESDNLGGLIARKKGRDSSVKVLLLAHLDECGFMVKSIDKNGYIRVLPLGGWNPPVALGQRVRIRSRKGDLIGIFGAKPPHEMTEDEKKKTLSLDDMWIDAGVTEDFNPAKECGVRLGDPVAPWGEYQATANPKIDLARNWDNRVGCAALIRVFQELQSITPPCDVYGAFTVQEEVGLRGAGVSAWMCDPSLAIALDVSLGRDTPCDSDSSDAKLGGGACLLIYDTSMIPHLGFRDALAAAAEANSIKHHFTFLKGGYDTGAAHRHKTGVPSAVIGIPSRYIHGFGSMVHHGDIDDVVSLTMAFIQTADASAVEAIRRPRG